MVYRDAASGTCAVCNALTDGGCLRCGQLLCERHRPPRDLRCPACEAEFAELVGVFDSEIDETADGGAGFVALLARAARGVSLWRLRRRFLRERPSDLARAW